METQFAATLSISKADQRKWANELYRRTHECKAKFPARHTQAFIPLPIGHDWSNGSLGRPVFGNYNRNEEWFAANGIATRVWSGKKMTLTA